MRKKVYFKSDAAKICGILNVPKRQKHRGFIVVFCHGWQTSKNSSKIVELSSRLAVKGISSFAFDFFGHGESDGPLNDITQTKAMHNLRDAIAFLKKKGYKKFGLYGSSFGGGTVSAYAGKARGAQKDLEFICLISTVTKYSKSWLIEREKRIGKIPFAWKDLKKYDYFRIAERIRVPALIVQGDSDKLTRVAGARKFFRLLKGEKMMVVIKGGDHSFSKKKQRHDALSAIYNYIMYSTHATH